MAKKSIRSRIDDIIEKTLEDSMDAQPHRLRDLAAALSTLLDCRAKVQGTGVTLEDILAHQRRPKSTQETDEQDS